MTRRRLLLVSLACLGALAAIVLVNAPRSAGPAANSSAPDGGVEAEAARSEAPDASTPATRDGRPSLVLITIDTLRADALGCYGHEAPTSPRLDALAAHGVRFARAYAPAPWTAPSISSILTGVYPGRHGVIHGQARRGEGVLGQEALPEALKTLATRLREAGYRTYGVTTNAHLDASLGFGRGFEQYEDLGFAPIRRLRPKLMPMLETATSGDGPYFLWIHIFDPHAPYRPYRRFLDANLDADAPRFPELHRSAKPGNLAEEIHDDAHLDYLKALYDGEVRRTDDFLRQVLRRLGPAPVVVVTSDHGEEFRDHGGFGHGDSLYQELIHVPLLVRLPGAAPEAGRVVDEAVSLVDLLPTFLELAELSPDRSLDGVSLVPGLRGESVPARTLFSSLSRGNRLFAVLDAGHVLIDKPPENEGGMLFDLSEDPAEQTNLWEQEATEVARLRALAAAETEREAGLAQIAPQHAVDPATEAQLRALGYAQ